MPRPMKTFFYLFCLCTFLWTLPCISPAQSPINNDIIEKVLTELENNTDKAKQNVSVKEYRNWPGIGGPATVRNKSLPIFASGTS